mmetsp:Transcript_41139/g.96104  ORF Transcript_41139/g.96104 Transcript_41139/m.96104 type:complete len:369 (+) Transcript_41139:1477-2583(+)
MRSAMSRLSDLSYCARLATSASLASSGCARLARSSGTTGLSRSWYSSDTSGIAPPTTPLASSSLSSATREAEEGKASMLAMRFVFSCSRSYSSKLTSTTGEAGATESAARTAREASSCISAGGGGDLSDLEVRWTVVSAYAWKSLFPATQKIIASCEWYAAMDEGRGGFFICCSSRCTSSTVRYASCQSSSSMAVASCEKRVSRCVCSDSGVGGSRSFHLGSNLVCEVMWFRRISHSRRNSTVRLYLRQKLKALAAASRYSSSSFVLLRRMSSTVRKDSQRNLSVGVTTCLSVRFLLSAEPPIVAIISDSGVSSASRSSKSSMLSTRSPIIFSASSSAPLVASSARPMKWRSTVSIEPTLTCWQMMRY